MILLFISDISLRRLYHELLFAKNIEVVPTETIEGAIVLLTTQNFPLMVMYVDTKTHKEVSLFLKLRKQNKNLSETRLILLTPEPTIYKDLIIEFDILLDSDKSSPVEVLNRIQLALA